MTWAPKVGACAEMSRIIEPGDIELFARISGDRNPIHFDVAAANPDRSRGFGPDRRVETRKCLPSRGNLGLRRLKISSVEGTP
jgi:hypothetical protein